MNQTDRIARIQKVIHEMPTNSELEFQWQSKRTLQDLTNFEVNFLLSSSFFEQSEKTSRMDIMMDNNTELLHKAFSFQENNFKEEAQEKQKSLEQTLKKELEERKSIFKKISLSFEIDFKVPKLSFTLKQFPDDIAPKEFFVQNSNQFLDYIGFLQENYLYSEVLQICYFNY